MLRIPVFPLALATVSALVLSVPALADETTKTQPTPPNFSGAGKPPAPTPDAPTPPGPATPPVQVGAPVPAPNPADARGFDYEKRRIKRTVPLSPSAGVEGVWDLLYATGEGEDRKAVYFDWDDNYLYLAAESAAPTDVRFDLDIRGDGWFRGADNLSITVSPPVDAAGLPRVSAQRWDTAQNKDRPVWAASPIPVSVMKAAVGRTPKGNWAALLALPRTEEAGLARKAGATFGFRADFGLPPALQEAALYTPRPMLSLTLADAIDARRGGLRVQVKATPREVVPGAGVRLALEVKNEGPDAARLGRLFLRGSQTAQPLLDAATFTGEVLQPGQKFTRELSSGVSGAAGLGTLVVAGGVETDDGAVLAALASFDRVEPFSIDLTIEDKPVRAGVGETRTALVSLRSRSNRPARGKVTLQLPPGWSTEKGAQREVSLGFAGERRGVYYEIAVPAGAMPGSYPIQADVRIAGRAYTAGGTVSVTRAVAAP